MQRESRHFLEDILDAIQRAQRYTSGVSWDEFIENELVQDGVVRNLEVIGEATKHLPENLRALEPHIPWREVAGMRNVISHHYWGIDFEVVWNVVQAELGVLARAVRSILTHLDEQPTPPSSPA